MSDPTGVRISAFSEEGMTGLIYSASGYVEEEFLPNLIGRQAIRVWREMRDNDAIIGSMLFAIDMLLRSVEWKTEENPDGQDPEGDAEFLQQCMEDMSHSWPDFVSEIMTMLPFGWSWFEIVYKARDGEQDEIDPDAPASSRFDDGKVGWRKFAIRAQESMERWVFDPQGGIQSLVQRPAPYYDERIIPIQKSLLFRTTILKNNPEGRSIFRNAYRSWFYKQRIETIEGIGVERDLAGLPVAYVDPMILKANADNDSKLLLAVIQKIVQNIKRDKNEGIVWPMAYDDTGKPLYDLKLLASGGTRQFDTNAIITRYNQQIAMTVLADFILLGHEQVGSFALSSDKTDLFAVAMGSYLDVIAGVLNRFAVPRLFRLNGMDVSNPPKIVHGDLDQPDLQEMAAYILSLVQAGMPMFPDAQLENHLRQIAHLPEVEDATDDIPLPLPTIPDAVVDPLDPAHPQAMPPQMQAQPPQGGTIQGQQQGQPQPQAQT